MNVFFVVLALLCMLCVVGSFLWGMVAMTKGGERDHKTSNKMMQMRVVFQALAILFLFLSYATK
ncbi:MAG: twin transmembrane helix small protein [Micavibrio sp.]|nr:twin transmembrane helix small protein [Micavibrio sp.]